LKLKFGVIESTDDPLRIGRCRVRIVGIHNADRVILPTNDLPWATPLQPINSAAVSGVGISPTGATNGAWVVVTFLDEDEQNPIILGSIGGVPSGNSNDFMFPDESDAKDTFDPPDTEKLPIQKEESTIEPNDLYLGSLTKAQYEKYKEAIKQKESSGDSQVVNRIGYIGWYQFGMQALESLGYIKKGSWSKHQKNSAMDLDEVWTAKGGITSKSAFLHSKSEQDAAFLAFVQYNYNLLKGNNTVSASTPPEKLAGLLGVAHNQGHVAAKKYVKGVVGVDGNNVSGTVYYNLGFTAVRGNTTLEHPDEKTIEREPLDTSLNRPNDNSKYDVTGSPALGNAALTEAGFNDPDGRYPKKDWLDEPDTHRLARNHKINKTIVGDKEATRVTDVSIALSGSTWNQPAIPYNTKYPYNKVISTESGHAFEMDDTPDSERINLHHSSGTFTEVDANGTQTNRIVGNSCTIVEKDGLILIKGSGHVKVEGNITIHVSQNVHMECDGDFNLKANKINLDGVDSITMTSPKINVLGEESVNLESQTVGIDGKTSVLIRSAAISSSAAAIAEDGYISTNVGMATAATAAIIPIIKNDMAYNGSVHELYVKTRGEEADFLLEGTDEAAARGEMSALVSEGETVTEQSSGIETKQEPAIVGCDLILPLKMSTQLSTNFTIEKLCIKENFAFGGQHNLSAAELACNMKNLCINVVEPLFSRYREKGIKINDGFRRAGSKTSQSKTISQHEKGEAVDIGFSNIRGLPNDRELYYELAQEIRNVIPFDQMLFEYNQKGNVWIHISFTTKKQLRYEIFTYSEGKNIGPGLILKSKK
jgi:hypothetical protein